MEVIGGAKAHIRMRCVDKGDNARMPAWFDIGATPESIGMSGAAGQSGVTAVGKASQKEAPVVWGDRGLGWEIECWRPKPASYDYHESGLLHRSIHPPANRLPPRAQDCNR